MGPCARVALDALGETLDGKTTVVVPARWVIDSGHELCEKEGRAVVAALRQRWQRWRTSVEPRRLPGDWVEYEAACDSSDVRAGQRP